MSGLNSLDRTKEVIKSVIISSPELLSVTQLDKDYYRQEGQHIPYSSLGFSSLKSFLQSISDVLKVDQKTGIVSLVISNDSKSNHVFHMVSEQKRSKKKGHYTTPRQQPIYRHKQKNSSCTTMTNSFGQTVNIPKFQPGLLLAPPNSFMNMPSYQNSFYAPSVQHNGISYNYTNHQNRLNIQPAELRSLSSESTLSNSVPSSKSANKSHNVCKSIKEEVKEVIETMTALNSKTQRDVGRNIEQKPHDTCAVPILDDDDPIKLIGTGYLNSKYGKKIPSATIPENVLIGNTHQICVTEVTSPSKFWFQFIEKYEEFHELQLKLSHTFGESPNHKIDRASQIQVGYACAAWYRRKWLRADIVAKSTDGMVKVCFVDFGTVAQVSIKNIRFLPSELCAIPRFSHMAALDLIEPIGDHDIEQRAASSFCQLVRNKCLEGVIRNMDENNTILVVLVDTTHPQKDVIINKEIIDICTRKLT